MYAPRIFSGDECDEHSCVGSFVIRRATPDDSEFVTEVGVAAGLFSSEDTSVTDGMMAAYFAGKEAEGHLCLIHEMESETGARERVGVAYVEPVRATDGTCELLMIAVAPRHQGSGRGGELLWHVEQSLLARGQRLLLVQTSAQEDYARTRAFYARYGYTQAALVPDYYAAGVDMVLFRKELTSAASS
jgi:ribosomal protein S18 acetylase RimI-like enzyme